MLKHKESDVLIAVAYRKNTIIVALDGLYQVFKNTSQHNKQLRERMA